MRIYLGRIAQKFYFVPCSEAEPLARSAYANGLVIADLKQAQGKDGEAFVKRSKKGLDKPQKMW